MSLDTQNPHNLQVKKNPPGVSDICITCTVYATIKYRKKEERLPVREGSWLIKNNTQSPSGKGDCHPLIHVVVVVK